MSTPNVHTEMSPGQGGLEKLLEAWELLSPSSPTGLTVSLFGFLSLSIVPRGGGYLEVETQMGFM